MMDKTWTGQLFAYRKNKHVYRCRHFRRHDSFNEKKLTMTSTSVLKGNISQYLDLLILMNGQRILKFQCWRVFSILTRN